jgi:site-specific DNA-methyltransferase (adenine-specific)
VSEIADVLEGRARWCVVNGDCLDVLHTMPDACIDAIVTDPPAGIAFMNAEWDKDKGGRDAWIAWLASVMREALRVCKPGAHALVWALPRTSHWTAMACENAGWQVRDRVAFLFASGFPKSHNVSKAIDRHNGDERPVNGAHPNPARSIYGDVDKPRDVPLTSAASAASAAWDGWGTALKPAVEDWWLLRKPLDGTIAENVLAHGTGGLNIDGGRISANGRAKKFKPPGGDAVTAYGDGLNGPAYDDGITDLGRWPANLALAHHPECYLIGSRTTVRGIVGMSPEDGRTSSFADGGLFGLRAKRAEVAEVYSCHHECPVKILDEQSGDRPGMSGGGAHAADYGGGMFGGIDSTGTARADSGGASRFFFTAKPSRSEREFGLEEVEAASVNDGRDTPIDNAYQRGETKRRNKHPTVKSLALMRWLVRLITPPGAIVLDPFSGSGPTIIAARREGFRAIGIEQSAEFSATARARIERWEQVRPDIDDSDALASSRSASVDDTQGSLFR